MIVLDLSNLFEILVAGIKLLRITASFVILNIPIFTLSIERPAVVGAGEKFFVATLCAAKGCTTVGASVDKTTNLIIFAADQHHRFAAHPGGKKIVYFRQVSFVGQENPVAFKNCRHLDFKQFFVVINITIEGEFAFCCAVDNNILQIFNFHQGSPQLTYLLSNYSKAIDYVTAGVSESDQPAFRLASAASSSSAALANSLSHI